MKISHIFSLSSFSACLHSPASAEGVFVVAASTPPDERWIYSNYGSCVDIFAPGKAISTVGHTSDSATTIDQGTSYAAAHVSGVAATILERAPNYNPDQVAYVLRGSGAPNHLKGDIGVGSPNLLLQTDRFGVEAPWPPNPDCYECEEYILVTAWMSYKTMHKGTPCRQRCFWRGGLWWYKLWGWDCGDCPRPPLVPP
jgi:hypothetical protein